MKLKMSPTDMANLLSLADQLQWIRDACEMRTTNDQLLYVISKRAIAATECLNGLMQSIVAMPADEGNSKNHRAG